MKNKDVILLEKLYTLIQPTRLDEVKWEEDFPDAKRECITPDAVAKQLNDELKRLETPSPKRSKPNINFPLISKGNIPDNANVENFKRQLMLMPKTIFDVGLKSGHTVDETIMTVNTGIPALRAVIWDEENKEFYVINTCPSAGSCISNCYARHGFYIMNDGKNIKLINRLQLLMNHPDLYESKAYSELELFAFDAKRKGKTLEIRWNDAGDFFSNKYLDIAISITKKLTINGYKVESYAYTKVALYKELSREFSERSVEFCWGRLFYLYGEGEDKRRLVPYIHNKLSKGETVELTNGNKILDYLNVSEASRVIAEIALSYKQGPFNICSGKPITIKELAEQIADIYGRRDLLKFNIHPKNFTDPINILGIPNY